MGNKLTPKVILEGTRLTFKTEIAFELNEYPGVVGSHKRHDHSPLIFPIDTESPRSPGLPTDRRGLFQ